MEKKNICIFIHGFEGGGAERMTVVLANRLAKLGHSVTFLVRYGSGEARELLDARIPVADMGIKDRGKVGKNLINLTYLIRFLKDHSYDVMLCVTIEMSQVAAAASFFVPRRHVPMISVIHNTVSAELHSFDCVRRRLYPMLDKRMSQVIAVSDAVGQDYRKVSRAGAEKVHTVYNPVISEEVFLRSREKADHPWLVPDRSWRTLVLSGRLTWQKNHELMFKAMKLLKERGGGIEYRLILLGEGERQTELEKLVKQMGLEQNVDFHGYVKNPYAYYAACDMLVLSSRYEGLPTVLIEALACGCRIVSADCPFGPREILGDETYGLLVPMEDDKALADGIERGFARSWDKEDMKKRAMDFNTDASVKGYLKVIAIAAAGRGAYAKTKD